VKSGCVHIPHIPPPLALISSIWDIGGAALVLYYHCGVGRRKAQSREDVLHTCHPVRPHNPFTDNEPYYGNQISTWVAIPTNDTRALLALIGPLLSNIWRDGHHYQKGGVMLADFTSNSIQQGDLFICEQQGPRSNALMQVIDKINQEGLGKVYFGTRGQDTSEWMMKREQLSPRYTTVLTELPVVE
jgi:hypothetical protein